MQQDPKKTKAESQAGELGAKIVAVPGTIFVLLGINISGPAGKAFFFVGIVMLLLAILIFIFSRIKKWSHSG
ncbi:hypothetical protein ACFL35_01210 [Candidatus Riflebacteria bacterium]